MDNSDVTTNMDKALDHFESELGKVSTGRANPAMVDGVKVEVYGVEQPLKHVANILAVDAQTLQIQPFDPGNLDIISAAIRDDQALGFNPSDDGKVVRINMPPMTTETRQATVKQLHGLAEECRVALRNVRHDGLKDAKNAEKDGDISKDDYRSAENSLNDLIDSYNKKVEEMTKAKEAEIMTV